MVDLKFEKKLIQIGTGLGLILPNEVVNKYKLEKGMMFELDIMEEPHFVLLLKKIENEEAKEVDTNEKD